VGDAVIRQGDAGNCLYLIESGEVVVTARQGDGPDVEVARLAAGSVFGEMSLMTGEPRTATAAAVGECRLLVFDKPAVEPILLAHPELAERISQILVERQAALRSRLADGPTEQRRNVLRRIREFFTLSRGNP
jgi:CRP-like cAMP-binding protein